MNKSLNQQVIEAREGCSHDNTVELLGVGRVSIGWKCEDCFREVEAMDDFYPDYLDDMNLCMGLVNEMITDKDTHIMHLYLHFDRQLGWRVSDRVYEQIGITEYPWADIPQEAIIKAWLAWKGER